LPGRGQDQSGKPATRDPFQEDMAAHSTGNTLIGGLLFPAGRVLCALVGLITEQWLLTTT
ncbi:MAG: hypothetical protein KDE31_15660, partial [Caldilineaceae bacterium]|nr:hypothetical protein [Caldilineaceae bacterium]